MAEEVFLDIEDVPTTLGTTPSSRNFKEGQALLNARHVILCAASQKSTTDIYIFALCLQTTAINSEPHEITGHIKLGKALIISNLLCSCKAGAGGKCKHMSAMLLYCTRNNIMQLEVVSSTDEKCLWKEKKVPVVDQYQAMPLLDTNCFQQLKIKAKEPCPDLSDLNYEAVLSTFLEACPNSALALHRLGRSNPEHSKEVETVALM